MQFAGRSPVTDPALVRGFLCVDTCKRTFGLGTAIGRSRPGAAIRYAKKSLS